jgi:hypothetical protein
VVECFAALVIVNGSWIVDIRRGCGALEYLRSVLGSRTMREPLRGGGGKAQEGRVLDDGDGVVC